MVQPAEATIVEQFRQHLLRQTPGVATDLLAQLQRETAARARALNVRLAVSGPVEDPLQASPLCVLDTAGALSLALDYVDEEDAQTEIFQDPTTIATLSSMSSRALGAEPDGAEAARRTTRGTVRSARVGPSLPPDLLPTAEEEEEEES